MRLLAAVNLGDEVCDALAAEAGRWAVALQATLDLVYVGEVSPVPGWVSDPLSADLMAEQWDRMRKDEADRLQALQDALPTACRGKAIRKEGRPAATLLEMAPTYDGVLIAQRGHSALERVLLGSVAAKVIRGSEVPVLALPGGWRSEPGSDLQALLGVDLRASDKVAGFDAARIWVERLGARLDLSHVDSARMQVPYIVEPDLRSRFDREWAELRGRDHQVLQGHLEGLRPECRGEVRLEEGDPAEMLSKIAQEYGLVVLATHGRTGLSRLFMGSVAEEVLHACERPTLVVRA